MKLSINILLRSDKRGCVAVRRRLERGIKLSGSIGLILLLLGSVLSDALVSGDRMRIIITRVQAKTGVLRQL